MRPRRLALCALLLVLAGSCTDPTGDGETGPGILAVRLQTPNTGDVAVELRLTGPEITGITVEDGLVMFTRSSSSTTHWVAVFGPLEDGGVIRFSVPDVSKLGSYSVMIVDVAGADNVLRPSLTGYGVSVVR